MNDESCETYLPPSLSFFFPPLFSHTPLFCPTPLIRLAFFERVDYERIRGQNENSIEHWFCFSPSPCLDVISLLRLCALRFSTLSIAFSFGDSFFSLADFFVDRGSLSSFFLTHFPSRSCFQSSFVVLPRQGATVVVSCACVKCEIEKANFFCVHSLLSVGIPPAQQ